MADPFLSEIKYLGAATVDFVEIAVDPTTDVSNLQVIIYNKNGTVRSTNSLGTLVGNENGKDIYVIDTATSATFSGLHKHGGVALYDSASGTLYQFVSFTNDAGGITATEGPASGVTSDEIGEAGSGASLETTDGGGSYSPLDPPSSGSIPCFVTGSRILTEHGERLVEDIKAGDMVVTLDHGLQAVRWVGRRDIDVQDMAQSTAYIPVLIKAHSFGRGQPTHDLWISQNHRILVQHYWCNILFGQPETFVAAKFLCNGKSIILHEKPQKFSYHHILFDQHEVVLSNNMPTESFHPGQEGLRAYDPQVREEVLQLLPELRTDAYPDRKLARTDLRKHEARAFKGLLR